MSEWISVSSKRKRPKGKVIWYHPAITSGRNQHQEYYRIDFGDLPNRPATHWMKLPEPPL